MIVKSVRIRYYTIRINLLYYLFIHKTCLECCDNNKRPTGKMKNTNTEWDDGGKIGNKNKLILTEVKIPSIL